VRLDSARELKRRLLGAAGSRRTTPPRAGPSPTVFASLEGAAAAGPLPVAVGIAGTPRSYRLAVRVHDPFPGIGPWLERVKALARGEVDIRVVGKVRPQAAWHLARHRPLAVGSSIGHARVTAGTLGAFVLGERGAGRFVLSNNHVLADEDRARKGDAVLQPGRADGGRSPADVVARYERAVRLKRSGNRVDAAIARLDEGVAIDAVRLYGVGALLAPRDQPLAPGDRVIKVGRTTGTTRGVVSAIEVDRVIVGYDRGELRFDEQVEITPLGRMPFSRGGDSGALVVDGARHPAALLFAGNDADTTYASPIEAVLSALRVRWIGTEAGVAAARGRNAQVKARAREVFARHGRVTGVGMTKKDGRPALKVNFARAPRSRARMPKEIDGLPVVVAVTGDVRKQEA
jgi:hypothetical protein